MNELVPRVRNALVVKAHHDHLKGYSDELETEVRQRTAELVASRLHVVHALARAAEGHRAAGNGRLSEGLHERLVEKTARRKPDRSGHHEELARDR